MANTLTHIWKVSKSSSHIMATLLLFIYASQMVSVSKTSSHISLFPSNKQIIKSCGSLTFEMPTQQSTYKPPHM